MRFTAEAFDEGGVGTQFGVENLECDGAIEQLILRSVDERHATAGNQVRDLVTVRVDAGFVYGLHSIPSLGPL